jgi:hypothetical protein
MHEPDIYHVVTVETLFPRAMVSRAESKYGREVAQAAFDAWAKLAELGILLRKFGV